MKRAVITAVVLAAFLATGSAQAGVSPDLLCKEQKAKAAGKKAFDLMKAFGKNLKKPSAAKLGQDISKAQSKFTKSFSKAEAKGGCLTSDDSDAIETKVDAHVFDVVANIDSACGDGIQAGPNEECDGSDDSACPGRCIAAGAGGGTCGDNTINGGAECSCAVEECDGTDDDACPGICQPNCRCPEPLCGNGVLEVGEECEPPCSEDPPCGGGTICGADCTCVPADPCNCGTPDPTLLDFVPKIGTGVCGDVRDSGDAVLTELDCGRSYLGGGILGAFAIKGTGIPVGGNIHKVECCYGTTLVLGNTTAAETGSIRDCTSAGCGLGGPVPTITTPAIISVCSVDTLEFDAFGFMDCSSGEGTIHMPMTAGTHLVGDGLKRRCDAGAGLNRGRLCAPRCTGGTNDGIACTQESNCPGGCSEDGGITCLDDTECAGNCSNPPPGTCDQDYDCLPGQCLWDYPDHCDSDSPNAGAYCTSDTQCAPGTCVDQTHWEPCPICNPETLKCNGGPNDGMDCKPQGDLVGSGYPTSQDCPPPPGLNVATTHMPYPLHTGTTVMQADGGQFCGYCRDVDDEGSSCFEGDPDIWLGPAAQGCPDSALIPDCKPQSYHAGVPGASIDGCGPLSMTRCASSADCYMPYETCLQRDPGAFDEAAARKITMWGQAAGSLSDRTVHDVTLSGAFCTPASFSDADQNASLPGPGAVSFPADISLRPSSPSGGFLEVTGGLVD